MPHTASFRSATFVLLVTLVWEFAEFRSDQGTHVQQGFLETGSDIILGLSGAVVLRMITSISGSKGDA